MNTHYIIIGTLTLLTVLALNFATVTQLLSNAKDRAYALGYSAGAASLKRELIIQRGQLADLQIELLQLRDTCERERRDVALALEQITVDADQRVKDAEARALADRIGTATEVVHERVA